MNMEELKQQLREAIANYMVSEGCSCCQDTGLHDKAAEDIAKLLDVEPYYDGSGYDFYKYKTK